MKTCLSIVLSLTLAASLVGCARPILLTPNSVDYSNISAAKVDKKLGLVIAEADRTREVTTPGGGGDKVSYFPYRDLELGLYSALSTSFAEVSKVKGLDDPKLKSEGYSILVKPAITTTSSSSSALTWPPTYFSIDINLPFVDLQGEPVKEIRVQGEGRAEFDEFKADHSLAAKRASEDVLKKLIKAISDSAQGLR
jgi:hypothetical protein